MRTLATAPANTDHSARRNYLDLLFRQAMADEPRPTITVSYDPTVIDREAQERSKIIQELTKADPDYVEAYCQKIIDCEASSRTLLFALSNIVATLGKIDYPPHNRQLIRDSLKKVLFHARLDNAGQTQIYEAVHRISRMI